MGGCRCTYRNCTQRSDSKIHLFHYPVFDRVRCHQWLTNAQRLDFLDLKVSQLKNRVICQHHFKPECFMNELMDKLKFEAVPTLNGPFCEATDDAVEQTLPIPIEDIEQNQLSFIERKANSLVKYGDFLINCEFVDTSKTDIDYSIKHKWHTPMNVPTTMKVTKQSQKPPSPPTQIVPPFVTVVPSDKINNSNMLEITVPPQSNKEINSNDDPKLSKSIETTTMKSKIKKRNAKIVVLSEERVDKPITIQGELKIVPPTLILSSSNKANINVGVKEKSVEQNEISGNILAARQEEENYQRVPEAKEKSTTPKKQLTPSEKAKIDEKRIFNKKLRDMIEFCLEPNDIFAGNEWKSRKPSSKNFSRMCDLEKRVDNITYEDNSKNGVKPAELNKSVGKEAKVDEKSASSFNHAALEARLNRMENLLLSKIDQNSERIIDLKKTLVPKTVKKSISTQTVVTNEEAYKKHLYEELSKFLSPNANNLVYEELFINKFAKRSVKRTAQYSGNTSVLKQRKLR